MALFITAFNSQSVKFPKKGKGYFPWIIDISWNGILPKIQISWLAVAELNSDTVSNNLINITNEEKQTTNNLETKTETTVSHTSIA